MFGGCEAEADVSKTCSVQRDSKPLQKCDQRHTCTNANMGGCLPHSLWEDA